MDPTPDELAGIADLFGGLTRSEYHEAIENLAARRGSEYDADALDHRIEEAVDTYALVWIDYEGETVFAPGPTAFPSLPEHAEDLPHMMDDTGRDISRERLAKAATERLATDAVEAIDAGETARMEELLDLCYELEAWASVDLEATRDRLADAIEG